MITERLVPTTNFSLGDWRSGSWLRVLCRVLEAGRRRARVLDIPERILIPRFDGPSPNDRDRNASHPLVGMTYHEPGWAFERSTDSTDELGVGETVSFTKRISDDDVRGFARASGDTNRLHLDECFAGESRFGGRIVHGALLSSVISAALALLPGVPIYLSQDVEFLAPVEIGTTVTAHGKVVETLGGQKYRLVTTVSDEQGNRVIEGEAVVRIDERPDVAATGSSSEGP